MASESMIKMANKGLEQAGLKHPNVTTPPQATTNSTKTVNTNSKLTSPAGMEGVMNSAAKDVPDKPADVSSAPTSTPTPTAEACSKIINASETLVDALESMVSAYAPPSTPIQVFQDDTLEDIKVSGDTIVAPGVSPKGKENAIIRSIAAALDYISQRVDEKLNDYHTKTTSQGAMDEHIKNVSNPSKGKVISRHVDPDGNEVIVYDNGLVDMANTKTALQFVSELRENGTIPQIKRPEDIEVPGEKLVSYSGGLQKKPIQYFGPEDDITNGVEGFNETDEDNEPTQGASNYGPSGANPGTAAPNPNDNVDFDSSSSSSVPTTDIASQIGESADVLDMVSKYNNTRHLGYDIFTECGFKNLKPIDFFEESTQDIPASDIKHMKFDNTHIVKAIKYFNAARAEQPEAKGNVLNMTKLVNSKNWDNGIKELEKQFDCHISLTFMNQYGSPKRTNAATLAFSEDSAWRQKCSVSKSKGFQLHGLPINILVFNQMFTRNAPTDPNLFGQAATAVILHEIFHNVMRVMRTYNVEFNAMLSTTCIAASTTKSAKNRRKLFTNFLGAAEKLGMIRMSRSQKKVFVKKMLVICSMKDNQQNLDMAEKLASSLDDSKIVDEIITRKQARIEDVKETARKEVNDRKLEIGAIIGMALSLSMTGAGMMTIRGAVFGMGLVGFVISMGAFLVGKTARLAKNKEFNKEFDNLQKGMYREKDLEEHWCDMFAAMYNLPVSFFHDDDYKITANNMSEDQIKTLYSLEKTWGNIMNDPHPATLARMSASVKAAQSTLNSGVKLDPCVKEYLEWIVKNNSKLLEVEDIDNLYDSNTFDPKTAENLDAHIQSLITNSGTPVTEQVVYDILTC